MKLFARACRWIVTATLMLSAFAVSPVLAQSGSSARVIMRYASTADRDAAFNRLLDLGAAVRVVDTEAGAGLVVLGSPASLQSEIARAVQVSVDARVAVRADRPFARRGRPQPARAGKPPVRPSSAPIERIGSRDNGGVAVAVIDSGLMPHADLPIGRLRYYKDFVSGSTTPTDTCGHGTHVAGIVAGSGASSSGKYAGIAPQVELVVLRVLDQSCSGNTSDVIDALEWVARNHRAYNIKVVNLSLGHDVTESIFTDPLVHAVERLSRKGIAVVTAAGNRGNKLDASGNPEIGPDGNPIRVHGGVGVPCNAPSSICVGSLNTFATSTLRDDRVAYSSSSGPTRFELQAKPDMVAPGVKIVSLAAPGSMLASEYPELFVPGNSRYFTLSGTSMASPAVAASAALLLEGKSTLTANTVKMALQFTSRIVPEANVLTQGAGALNLGGAMKLADAIVTDTRIGRTWIQRRITASNTDGAGNVINWGRRIIYGDRFMDPRYAEIHLFRFEDHLVWGYDAIEDNIVWGNSRPIYGRNIVWGNARNIVWGNWHDDNIVWGNRDNIVWGNDDNIVWGNSADDNIVWGNSEDDNIVWGNADDNIVWGNSDDNIVWGNDDDNIVWGNGMARGQWASKLITGFWDDNIVWGNVSHANEDNIVWGNNDDNIVWGNCSESLNDDNIVWGNADDNIVWGNCDNIVWGNSDDNIVWGNSVLTGSGK